jgi:hypothetical protein
VKLPQVGEIDLESLNPAVHEEIRWTFATVFGDSDEPKPKLPAGLSVPLLDQVIGLRFACQVFIEVVENSDLPKEKKRRTYWVSVFDNLWMEKTNCSVGLKVFFLEAPLSSGAGRGEDLSLSGLGIWG